MEKALGAESVLSIELVDGKVKISAQYDGKGLDGGAYISADSDYFIDKLAAAVPGDSVLEAGIVAALKLALKSVKI